MVVNMFNIINWIINKSKRKIKKSDYDLTKIDEILRYRRDEMAEQFGIKEKDKYLLEIPEKPQTENHSPYQYISKKELVDKKIIELPTDWKKYPDDATFCIFKVNQYD